MIAFDAMGFPLVILPAVGLEAMLLPVTRTQFDFFLGDRTGFPSSTLQDIDRISPRRSWRTPSVDRPDGLFLTAIQADEAEAFARWLGTGFRLPNNTEWRAVDKAIGAFGTELQPLRSVLDERRMHPSAQSILARTLVSRAATWRTVGMFEDGLLEWVKRQGSGYGLQGRPRPNLLRVIHNPQAHDAIVPRSAERHPAFGMRLVRPLISRVP
jgi:hypothetical protein